MILKLDRDHFSLRISKPEKGEKTALLIGSHRYYPRIFSKNLTSLLKLICLDTRAFVPDLSSHKESDFTIDQILCDIDLVQQFLREPKVILIGHSIHAFMAIEYARQFPDRVSHLILISSSPMVGPEIYKKADRYFEESACPQRKAAFAKSMQNFVVGDQSFITRMLALGPKLWYDYHFDATNLWEDIEINSVGGGIVWGPMFTNYDIGDALKAITCPIFLALGRYDFFNPPHLWEKYRNHASDLTVRIFEKSGHTPPFEEPINFDEELTTWLRR